MIKLIMVEKGNGREYEVNVDKYGWQYYDEGYFLDTEYGTVHKILSNEQLGDVTVYRIEE